MADEILLKFLLIITILFFVPKVLFRVRQIPYTLTEVVLGAALGIMLPAYFFVDDIVQLMAALGVITLFVVAGMEVDTRFVARNRRIIAENMMLQVILVFAVAVMLSSGLALPYHVGVLVALALLTPSASFIFSFVRSSAIPEKIRKPVESSVLSSEILGIFMLLIFLNLGNPQKIALSMAVIVLMIAVLPYLLDLLYRKIFRRLIGVEFTFILVVALISAFITELIGVHFLIGAFIAGFVARRFLEDIKLKGFITAYHNRQISGGFSFFSMVFAPFYFFSIGLFVTPGMLTVQNISLAAGLMVGITAARFIVMLTHRQKRVRETYEDSFNITAISMPTILFTFVIAGMLRTNFGISDTLFAALLLYGILSTVIPVVLKKVT